MYDVQLLSSVEKRWNIHVLCRSLSGNCTEIMTAHWSRVAFLVCQFVAYVYIVLSVI